MVRAVKQSGSFSLAVFHESLVAFVMMALRHTVYLLPFRGHGLCCKKPGLERALAIHSLSGAIPAVVPRSRFTKEWCGCE